MSEISNTQEWYKHAILKRKGWIVECEIPFKIRHKDGSFATQQAAEIVTDYIISNYRDTYAEWCDWKDGIYKPRNR